MDSTTGADGATGYYAAHEVISTLELPPVPPGAQSLFLYAPTGKNPGNCLETVTAYFRYPGDSSTRREWWVWDHCNAHGVATSMPIDQTFLNQYVRPSGGRNMYLTETVKSALSDFVYYMLLYNYSTQTWDLIYTLTSTGAVYTTGWSSHENYFQQANICPSLPPIIADQIKLDFPNQGGWVLISPANSASQAGGWCAPSPYTLQVTNANYTWQVTTP